jgi:hypothetical protein
LCPGGSFGPQPRVEARNVTHLTMCHLHHCGTPPWRGRLPQPPCQLGRHSGPIECPGSAPAARKGRGSTSSTHLRPRPPQTPKRSEATQPHLTARRPRPNTRPLLLPHAQRGWSTARHPHMPRSPNMSAKSRYGALQTHTLSQREINSLRGHLRRPR